MRLRREFVTCDFPSHLEAALYIKNCYETEAKQLMTSLSLNPELDEAQIATACIFSDNEQRKGDREERALSGLNQLKKQVTKLALLKSLTNLKRNSHICTHHHLCVCIHIHPCVHPESCTQFSFCMHTLHCYERSSIYATRT